MRSTPEPRIDELVQRGRLSLASGNATAALADFEQALLLAQEKNDTKSMATIQFGRATALDAIGQHQKALDALQTSAAIWRQMGDQQDEAAALGKIGDVYRAWGFPEEALRFYKQAAPIASTDPEAKATLSNNTGLAFLDSGKKDKAIEHFREALASYHSAADRAGEAYALANIGGAYNAKGDSRHGIESLVQARAIAESLGNPGLAAAILNNLAFAYSAQHDRANALDCYERALQLYRQMGDARSVAAVQENLTRLDAPRARTESERARTEQSNSSDVCTTQPNLPCNPSVLIRGTH